MLSQVLLQEQSLPARAGKAARLQVRTARRTVEAGEPQLRAAVLRRPPDVNQPPLGVPNTSSAFQEKVRVTME